jgi:hypothetical protein
MFCGVMAAAARAERLRRASERMVMLNENERRRKYNVRFG